MKKKEITLKSRVETLESVNTLMANLMTRWFSILIQKGIVTIEDLDAKMEGDFKIVKKEVSYSDIQPGSFSSTDQ